MGSTEALGEGLWAAQGGLQPPALHKAIKKASPGPLLCLVVPPAGARCECQQPLGYPGGFPCAWGFSHNYQAAQAGQRGWEWGSLTPRLQAGGWPL